ATAVMSLTALVNMYACVIEPDTMGSSYYKFVMEHTGLPGKFGPMFAPLMKTFQEQFCHLRDGLPGYENIIIPDGMTSRDFIAKNVSPNIATIFPKNLHHDYQCCALLHPSLSCTNNALDIMTGEFARAVKMYGTLNLVSTHQNRHLLRLLL